MAQDIKLIAADIDDTILNSKHELSERTEKALKAAKAQGAVIVLATGKTR
ncbi:MAG TPA: HAD hydrolase family protein, partial [Verrucomicrobiae bacterium]|nr:HAD hydrolase family protein [Verrucomicrobiae bacterium]